MLIEVLNIKVYSINKVQLMPLKPNFTYSWINMEKFVLCQVSRF